MQAAQDWFDNVQESKEEVYKEIYDTLLRSGKPHIKGLDKADGTAVLASIADKSGQFLSKVDKFMVYVSKEEETIKKKPVTFSQEAKKSISDYYKAAQDLCNAQSIFMQKTQEMQEAVKEENIFLDIIRQVQLPAVQVIVRMRRGEEAIQGKTYQELSLTQHLPDYQKLQPMATDVTRTMAAFMYYAFYKQLTGKAKSQQGCSEEFSSKTTPFKRLVTGKKQGLAPRSPIKDSVSFSCVPGGSVMISCSSSDLPWS